MAQQNIDFGTFPDDPNADAIRTAFRKTQQNFDQLFATAEQQAVLSVNRTPGAGITVNSPTGNVVVSANIACVQVSTSTLSIGISANGSNSAVLTSTNQVLVVDLPNTISNVANITLVNNVTANYMFANIGTTTGNLTVNANTSTNNLSVLNDINSNTISVYDASVSNLTTLSGYIQPLGNFISTLRPNTSSIDVGTVTSYFGNGYFDNVYVNNNFVSSNLNVNTLISTNSINVSNNANIIGNILANNVNVNNNTITNNLTVNLAFTGNTANIVNISANTFTLNANPIMAVGVITPVYDTVYLPSNVVVSGTTSSNATSVLSITVPSQGTYQFTSQMIVLPGTGASQPISFGLYDGNGTLVANSEVMGSTSDASNQKTTITGTTIVTSSASQTYSIKAWGTGLSPGILTYGGNGQSSLKYVRLDAVATITTNASVTFGNVTTTSNVNVTNNLTVGGSIIGNLSGNFTGTISNGTSNINIPVVDGNVNIVSGGITSLVAKPTGANVLGTLDTSGNITGLNLGTSGNVIATGNISGSSIESGNVLVNSMSSGQLAIASTGGKLVGGPDLVWNFSNADLYSTGYVSNRYVTATGNITGGNLITGGTLSVTGNANLGNLGTNTAIITTGNITTINSGLLQNGTSNIKLDLSGNLSTYIGGNVTAQFVVTNSGANIAGTANVIGNANVGNLGSTDGVFTGNVTANNLSTTNQITAGNGLQVTTGTVTILNGNLDITGNINATGNLNYSNVNDLVVGDPLIYIGANNTGDTYDLGLVGSYNEGTYYHTGIARNSSDNYWTFFDGVVAEPTTIIDWANAVYPTVKLGNLLATGNANIAGYANIVGNANIGNIGTSFVVATSNITGANIYANSGTVGALYVTGTLTTNSQPNVTSLGTLTGLDINGTVTAGNITANTGVITGNGSSISALNASNISTGTLDQARLANSSLTVNGVAISLGGSGTVTASTTNALTFDNAGTGASSGSTFDGSTARTISYNTIGAPSTTGTNASGSWGISVTGSANTVTNAAQSNITSVGTLTSLDVTGNVTAGNVYANSGTIGASLLTGTLTTSTQPNITSLGSLTGLTSSGTINFTGASNVSLGAVGNLKITGGSSGQYLQTNGSGTLTWASVAAGYGDSNVATFLGSYGSNTISTTGNITGGNLSGIMRPTSGSGTAGIIFPSDPGGGSGDVASIKWYAYSGEDCYLELNVQNDANDRIRLVASGGVQMNTGGLGVGTTPSGTDGEIRATNNITAYYSDDRLKKRLGVIENALDKVNSLTGFFYEANETAQELGYKPKREVGLSAQEVERVLPEVVAPAPIDDKYKTLHYERIIPLLVEAIKEISAELSDLKNTLRNNNVK
jgi:hypothetical protein